MGKFVLLKDKIAFEGPLTKRSRYYAADTATLSLGLEVDLFRQKLA